MIVNILSIKWIIYHKRKSISCYFPYSWEYEGRVRYSYSLYGRVAQTVKCLPAMQETQVQSLVQEDILEKEMATHSSTLAWTIPWTEEPDRLQSMESQKVRHDWAISLHFTYSMWWIRAIPITEGYPRKLSTRDVAWSALNPRGIFQAHRRSFSTSPTLFPLDRFRDPG